MIFAKFAEGLHWTPEQVGNLTLRQLKNYCTPVKELEAAGEASNSTLLDLRIKRSGSVSFIDKAVENLINGKRWDE